MTPNTLYNGICSILRRCRIASINSKSQLSNQGPQNKLGHTVIVTINDNKDYVVFLLHHYDRGGRGPPKE